jgi:indoleamine 2,3-dioxygenase
MNLINYKKRGFLPESDPLTAFFDSRFKFLDEIGNDLPNLLEKDNFRDLAKTFEFPSELPETLEEKRLYYVRLGFLASGYINQLEKETANVLPKNIAIPLTKVCNELKRPPILSYDGYALYNWKRLDGNGPIALGNIDTFQNFVNMYDEHWFILVHVEIENIASEIFDAIENNDLKKMATAVWKQVDVLKRIPEYMDSTLYYKTFRKYIRFFEDVIYEGVDANPMNYRGETGAQSSILPALVSYLKIPHSESMLTKHLADMRNFMPAEHRQLLESIDVLPSIKETADKNDFNEVLEAIASFREIHYSWAYEYIARWERDVRGTGGTPYSQWLKLLIDETRNWKK